MEMMVVDKGSGAWHLLTPSWMPCGRGSVGALPRRDGGDSQVRRLALVWWRISFVVDSELWKSGVGLWH